MLDHLNGTVRISRDVLLRLRDAQVTLLATDLNIGRTVAEATVGQQTRDLLDAALFNQAGDRPALRFLSAW